MALVVRVDDSIWNRMTYKTKIFHYTNLSGLLGILSSKEIWASDCHFLNDGSELLYAQNLFFSEFKKLDLPPLEGGGYRLPRPMADQFGVYITCFCENGDLLSQWRGYGSDQCYSIGFSIKDLRSLSVDQVNPVQYGIEDPGTFFHDYIEYAKQPTESPGFIEDSATKKLLPKLAIIKDPGFSEEKEWRLVKAIQYREANLGAQKISFRPSNRGPIGYIKIPIKLKSIKEIFIGPGSNVDIKHKAIDAMLQTLGLGHKIKVIDTSIPFRG